MDCRASAVGRESVLGVSFGYCTGNGGSWVVLERMPKSHATVFVGRGSWHVSAGDGR